MKPSFFLSVITLFLGTHVRTAPYKGFGRGQVCLLFRTCNKYKECSCSQKAINNDTPCIVWGHLKIVSFSINPFASLSTNERILEFTFSSHKVLYH